MEDPEIDSHLHSSLIFDKGAKAIQWGEESLFKNMVLKQMDNEMGEKMTLDLHLTLYIKNN